jgi:hypothetical protein
MWQNGVFSSRLTGVKPLGKNIMIWVNLPFRLTDGVRIREKKKKV